MRAVLEGHDRGVNWCDFSFTNNYILSASDDRKVKVWKYNDQKAWEQDSLFGHMHNVSSVLMMMHNKKNSNCQIIVSDSEDKTIRFWDLDKKVCLNVFKKEHDRFWIIA